MQCLSYYADVCCSDDPEYYWIEAIDATGVYRSSAITSFPPPSTSMPIPSSLITWYATVEGKALDAK